jgi:hypothetical protein
MQIYISQCYALYAIQKVPYWYLRYLNCLLYVSGNVSSRKKETENTQHFQLFSYLFQMFRSEISNSL